MSDHPDLHEGTRTGEMGYWHRSLGGPPRPRDPVPGPIDVDVAIVGAGYTGLWTAYYLKQADPGLNVAMLEARFAGYGASGRNGGWLMGACEGSSELYARRGGPNAVVSLRQHLKQTVTEVESVLAAESIDVDLVRGGGLTVAIGDAQNIRLRQVAEGLVGNPLEGGENARFLELPELEERLRIADARSAVLHPDMARIHPVKLVRGLADAVERLGVQIYESTPVGEIHPHLALTERGPVTARWVVRATEGYTAGIRGERRTLAPVNSSMIITEPLTEAMWNEIGWDGDELIGDSANVYFYMQKTADGRIAIGGRGVPYRLGSATDFGAEIAPRTVDELLDKVHRMFPAARPVGVAHGWSGVLGVPRDWGVSVNADPDSGLAWAGGYSGEGVGATNLAARILRDLLLERDTDLVTLPWVGHRPAAWEPEPFRYVGVRSIYAGYGVADRLEHRTGRPSALGRLLDRVAGR